MLLYFFLDLMSEDQEMLKEVLVSLNCQLDTEWVDSLPPLAYKRFHRNTFNSVDISFFLIVFL